MTHQSDGGMSNVSNHQPARRAYVRASTASIAGFTMMPALVAISAVTALAVPPSTVITEVTRVTSATGVSAAASCDDAFDSLGVELLSCIFKDDLSDNFGDHGSGNQGSDIWGYVSPSGREFALIGLRSSVSFVEVTDPRNPVIIGNVPGPSSVWRDMKTYQQHAYIVIDQTGNGLQIVDLTEIDDGVVTLLATSNDRNFSTAHNIALNPESEYAYSVGGNTDSGGLTPWDLSDPADPVALPGWAESDLHDALVVTYSVGDFAGREIAYGFAGRDGLKVIDVTDKNNIFTLATRTYPNLSYCHQGWLSEDRKYLFIDDELDESDSPEVDTSTTYVFDVSDPADPQFLTSYTNGIESIDHNLMVRGRFVFSANYTSGLRIFDTCDIQNVVEVGYFDTYPELDEANRNFHGAWGVFTDFPSKIVIVSDRERGLFVFDTSEAEATPPPLPECEGEEPCGNGVVDEGETCDIAILAGNPGACPTNCDTQDPCVIGTPFNMGTCTAACSHDDITAPTDGDGCCPQGANANNDNDCQPVCGNAACEAGEHSVNCSLDCPCDGNASCDDNDACTFDLCTDAACTNVEVPYGDTTGDGGTCGPDQTVGLVDILAVLNAFQGVYSDGCERYNMDLADCAQDGVIDLSDIIAILDAFQGTASCCK